MSLEERLTNAAIEGTGDYAITDVAESQPKGTAGATFAHHDEEPTDDELDAVEA